MIRGTPRSEMMKFIVMDQVARGDELGLVLPLFIMSIVSGINVYRTRRNNQIPATTTSHEMAAPGD